MITDAIINFFKSCCQTLINLVPNFKIDTDFTTAITTVSDAITKASYFLPMTAIKIFFVGVMAYYTYQIARYLAMLIIKYVTRML